MGKLKSGNPVKKPTVKYTRRELRKEKRLLKKRLKCLFFENNKQKKKSTLQSTSELTSCIPNTIIKQVKNRSPFKGKKLKSIKKVTFCDMKEDKPIACHNQEVEPVRKNEVKNKFKLKIQKERKKQLLDAAKKDEKEIKALEKRLKLNKRKNKSTSRGFVECGLDYILDACDSDRINATMDMDINLEDSDSDYFEDISTVKINNSLKTSSNENIESNESNCRSNARESINPLNRSKQMKLKCVSPVEKGDDSYESCEDSDFELDSLSMNEQSECQEDKLHEDIYGRLRDNKGNIIKFNHDKYVPPQLRLSESSEITKAKKQLKGLLNKLAQSNMYGIANGIENLYLSHSRNSINEILIEVILSNVVTNVITPERLVIDHAMLIGILHANVGSEIGAYLLQRFVEHFDSLFCRNNDVENKKLDNILCLISYLYTFKIFEYCLMYDLLNKLTKDCTEKNVDLILVVLRSAGFFLRKDDPNAMRKFLLSVQKQFNQSSTEDNTRLKYMLSVLINIKNNNISKLSEFNPSQHEELQKTLKSLIRKGNSIVALQIGLDDLLNAEELGRWWLVGSAWKIKGENKIVQNEPKREKFSAEILELAKKQRMNTDNRRNIFCILMTAEDYQDAFEKILRLGLKGHQEREIPLVMVHCLLQEKNYNPFYCLVADQLCISNRRHQMTLQCALWDRFRDLQSLTSCQIHILAQFLAHLFLSISLPISILKVVEFAELDKHHIRLIRQTILALANENNTDRLKGVFAKVSKPQKLSLFREALRLFIHHFILRNMEDGGIKDKLNIMSNMLSNDGN